MSLRLALAATLYAALTYLMVILEPKDRVHYRWLGSQLSSARLGAFLGGLQALDDGLCRDRAVLGRLAGVAASGRPQSLEQCAVIAAALGFLTRDVSLFVFMRSSSRRRRGDLAALAILVALYVLAPAIVKRAGAREPVDAVLSQARRAAVDGTARRLGGRVDGGGAGAQPRFNPE